MNDRYIGGVTLQVSIENDKMCNLTKKMTT